MISNAVPELEYVVELEVSNEVVLLHVYEVQADPVTQLTMSVGEFRFELTDRMTRCP